MLPLISVTVVPLLGFAFVLRQLDRYVLCAPKRNWDRPFAIGCLVAVPLLLLVTVLGAQSNEAKYAPAAAAATASIERQLELMDMRPASRDAIKVNVGPLSRTSERAGVKVIPDEYELCRLDLEAQEDHSEWDVGVVVDGEFIAFDDNKTLRDDYVTRQCAAPAR